MYCPFTGCRPVHGEMPRWRYVLNGAKMWITNGTVDGKETGDAYLVRRRARDAAMSDDCLVGMEGTAVIIGPCCIYIYIYTHT
jgi:alkylation response protein AidB-like acyl-CoA dehydrogenase